MLVLSNDAHAHAWVDAFGNLAMTCHSRKCAHLLAWWRSLYQIGARTTNDEGDGKASFLSGANNDYQPLRPVTTSNQWGAAIGVYANGWTTADC